MSNQRSTPVKVISQGVPTLSNGEGYCVVSGDRVACFFVDLYTKRCELIGSSEGEFGPEIFIVTSEYTPGYTEDDAWTVIAFPEFKGFRLHSATICKYTVAVALTKTANLYGDAFREPSDSAGS